MSTQIKVVPMTGRNQRGAFRFYTVWRGFECIGTSKSRAKALRMAERALRSEAA